MHPVLELEQHGIYFHITCLTKVFKNRGSSGRGGVSSIKNVYTECEKINEFGLALVSAGWLPGASHKLKSIRRGEEGGAGREGERGVVKKNPIWIDPRVAWYRHSSGRKRLQLAGFSAACRHRAERGGGVAPASLPEWEICCRTLEHWNLLAGKRLWGENPVG